MSDTNNMTGSSDTEKRLRRFCESAIERHVMPGCAVGVIHGDEMQTFGFGHFTYEPDAPAATPQTIYDLASITKSIPTSSVILHLVEQGRLSLDDQVIKYIPELTNDYRDKILVRHLLTFTVVLDTGRHMSELAREMPDKMLEMIYAAPLKFAPGTEYKYTNTPSMLLGVIAERVSSKGLDVLAQELFFGPLGMTRTTFRPLELVGIKMAETKAVGGLDSPAKTQIAPSAVNERGEIRGTVHDPGAWAMIQRGQVPGHAGLFSTVDDLLKFARMLLNDGKAMDGPGVGAQLLTAETIKMIHTNQTPDIGHQTGLGWEIDRPEIAGKHAESALFGKTGFTGTLFLVNPDKHLALVLLTNRTYPQTGERADLLELWRGVAEIGLG